MPTAKNLFAISDLYMYSAEYFTVFVKVNRLSLIVFEDPPETLNVMALPPTFTIPMLQPSLITEY